MIGEELRTRRQRMGLTQTDLARALALPKNTISRWEIGTMTIEHAAMLRWALKALDRDLTMARGDPAERSRVLDSWGRGNWAPHAEPEE